MANLYQGSALDNIEIDNLFHENRVYIENGVGINGYPFVLPFDNLNGYLPVYDFYNYNPNFPGDGTRSIFSDLEGGQKYVKYLLFRYFLYSF